MAESPEHYAHNAPNDLSEAATPPIAAHLKETRRIVIKVGSALVVDAEGAAQRSWLNALARDMAALNAAGAGIVLVSSGAVALGRRALGLSGALKLEEKQAAAAAGQSLLIEAWRAALTSAKETANNSAKARQRQTAQILLTLADMEDRRRYLNARATLLALLDMNALPVVNENDTTATDEIRYGDNDRLAAHVAQLVGADLLLMLSDIDGLYDDNPASNPAARHIAHVPQITPDIEAMAGGPNAVRGAGSGGMRTKIDAARIAAAAGCAAIVADGRAAAPISTLRQGARATYFAPSSSPEKARRNWIAGRLHPKGALHIDAGAVRALRDGASLLPAGVARVEGDFTKGDAVCVVAPDGGVIAQGLCAFDQREAAIILGRRSRDIETLLGYRRSAIIHRNDLVMMDEPTAKRARNNAP